MKLEICANSFLSAKNAQEAVAHRIELCSELSVGGVTPSYGLIKKVVEELTIETFVLVRPRSGDFVYSEAEFDSMKRDIQLCKDLGCHGIVSGVLNEDKTIDLERTKELVELSKPLSFTFHRAFDEVLNPMEALKQLMDIGVDRILTSGQAKKAVDGIDLLKQLKAKAESHLIILPGGGITSENVKYFKQTGFQELHTSASKVIKIESNTSFFDVPLTVSDPETIKAILNAM